MPLSHQRRQKRPAHPPESTEIEPAMPVHILLDNGVATRRGIMNAHQEGAYAAAGPYRLPHSEAARDAVVLLPLFHGLTDDEQDYVIDLLRNPGGFGGKA